MPSKSTKKLNKKAIISIIAVILVVILVIVLVSIFSKEEEEQTNNTPNEIETGDFETEIDMTNTENSKIREDGMKINTSSKIAKGIEFNDLLIKDITIESSGDMAVFNASVENDLGKDLEGYIIYLIFLDKDGKEIANVETFFPDIPSGETGYISATTPKDIATAYDLKVERQIR